MEYKMAEVVSLINFGSDLADSVIKSIEEKHKIQIKEVRIKASLNLRKNSTYIQCSDLIRSNKKYFSENEKFIINLPGLPIFSAFLITELHALTGKFPVILECIKEYDENNIFSSYVFKRLYDLDRERVQSRENYKNNRNENKESD